MIMLHPSFVSPYPLLTYAYSVKYDDWQKSEELDLSCLCVVKHRPCSQLSCNSMGTATLSEQAGVWDLFGMQTAFASLLFSIEGKARLYCCAKKTLVTSLFFSSNKLIDYSPAQWSVHVHVLVPQSPQLVHSANTVSDSPAKAANRHPY